ncbi:MAG: phosphotransferase [Flavobacteriaceae bacterium]|nr:phosphotransferase [Flavobacteriaceae bacterium]
MFTKQQIQVISDHLGEKIISINPASGGDIADSFLITTDSNPIFLKTHHNSNLLKSEKIGLETINKTKTIKTPEVLGYGKLDTFTFLALEWIDSKSPTSNEFTILGKQLAELHKTNCDKFGFEANNYIGSLHQSNAYKNNWNDFYIEERLYPQLQLAHQKGLLNQSKIPSKDVMKSSFFEYFKNITPSLLHGDLWSGNYLISTSGDPYLIDPSVYFGHSEIDIAMSKLFGGFGTSFYLEYHKIIPKDQFTDIRVELYQLYYLLVHLNLFGRSYYSSVKHILTKYF